MSRRAVWLLVLAAVTPAVASAEGDDAAGRTITSSPTVIASCLCQSDHLTALRRDADDAEAAIIQAKGRVAALDHTIADAREDIDPDDASAIDAFRRLLSQRDAAESNLIGTVQPDAMRRISRYNDAAARYTDECGRLMFDGDVLKSVQPTLRCTLPPDP